MSDAGESRRWPFQGDALLVDDEQGVRRAYAALLEAVGCRCHVAETYADAHHLVQQDSRITVVILDHGVAGDNTRTFVRKLKAIRPGIILVGSSGKDCREGFAAADVPRFVQKPWTADELIIEVHKFSECVDCGLPIPLRRTYPGEAGSSWVCRGCGSRYHAVLDEDAPPDHHRHVQPGE